jgi:hypothetical protein
MKIQTYKIVRYFHPSKKRPSKTMAKGLTLQQAQEHCRKKSSRREGEWFEGYTEE